MKIHSIEKLSLGLLMAALFVIGFNAFQLQRLASGHAVTGSAFKDSMQDGIAEQNNLVSLSGPDIIPKGVPGTYGAELGVSYDDVSSNNQQKADAAIAKLGTLDKQITLSGKDKERYIAVASQISCEYCCGVESIIFKDGSAACSCAHSFAMRGLAKYLIKYHSSEFTNEGILEELGKWKTLFFPSKLRAKAAILQQKGIELNYINIASNRYRGLESPS